MNWKRLGKAILNTCVGFAIGSLIGLLLIKATWLTFSLIFIALVMLSYSQLKNDDMDIADNSRMSWNSGCEKEDEEDEK